jgi:DNA-3-methyladenine glycosylase I
VKVAGYGEDKVDELRQNEGIIRHKGKITSAINNAQVFIEIQKEFGSFDEYIWSFTNGKTIKSEYLTESDLSRKISKDLKKRGMKFVGPTIIYSYLESIGIIDNHEKDCFRFKKK